MSAAETRHIFRSTKNRMTLLSEINKYLFIRQLQLGKTPTPVIWNTTQSGGGIVTYNGHRIHVRETIDKKKHLIFVSAGRLEGKRPCFMMELDTSSRTGTLISLERGRTCFIDVHESSKDLVRVAVTIAKQHGIHEIEFTDNSTIQCPHKIHLSDLSFLTTGKTWYESILPLEYMSNSPIEDYRRHVLSNSWNDVYHRITMLGFICPFDTSGIDISAPGSAMKVFARAKKDKSFCNYFSQYMSLLLVSSGITSLHGDSWKAHI